MKIKKVLLSVAATFFVIAGTWAQTAIPSYVHNNGLVGWWPFNGNANDLSVNANNGTVNGATLTADRYGNANKAYSFNSVNDTYIQSSIGIHDTLTFSAWFFCGAPSTFYGMIYSYGNASTNGATYSGQIAGPHPIWTSANKVGFFHPYAYNNGYLAELFSNSSVSDNQWHNIGVVYVPNDKIYLYLDGLFISNVTFSTFVITQNIVMFGRDLNNNAGGTLNQGKFDGFIDDIGIWNRALTPCEIKKLYTSGSFSVSSSASNTICVGQSLNLTAAGATTYNWNTGATSQSISVSPTVSTVYTVSTTYSAGCTDSRTFSVTVNACTGLNETEHATNSVRIFPNPAKEQLNISISNTAVMGKTYSITNALGQVVATGVFNKQIMELSIQQLSAGFYQLNIDGMQENYKFIKE
jgi:hypothetical protein